MIVRMLGPTIGKSVPLSSYLVNRSILIDCGGAGFCGDFDRQVAVLDVFLTHGHMDHVASLPILLDNVYGAGAGPPTVHAMSETFETLRQDIFNDRLWPDFVELSKSMPPFLIWKPLQPDEPVEVGGVKVTGVMVNHVVPTLAFILEEPGTSVAIISDTGPTEAIWDRVAATANVRAVFLECSFPEQLAEVAKASKHLTPRLFASQAARRPPGSKLYAIHLKPQHRSTIIAQLRDLCPEAEIASPEMDYLV